MTRYFLTFLFLLSAYVANAQTSKAGFFPMIPVYKKSGFSKVFMGLEIPVQYIHDLDQLKEAQNQLERLGLQAHFEPHRRVLGTVKKYKYTAYMKSSTFGISFHPTSDDTLYLGEELYYGLKINFSSGLSDLREKKGFSLSDPISTIMEKGALMIHGDSAFDVVENTLRYGLFWNRLFDRKGTEIDWPEARFELLKSISKEHLLLASDEMGPPLTPLNALEGRTAEKLSQLKENALSIEKNWQKNLQSMNDQAPVWNQVSLQTFVQNICTDIARAHRIPSPLTPDCRVFSTLKMGAISYPGGDLFLTAGMIANMESIDTLLFLISHEIAHQISRHGTLRLQKEDQATAFYNTVGLLASALSMVSMAGHGAESTLASLGVEKVSPYLIEQTGLGLLTEFAEDQEREADLIGFEMALRMGAQKEKILEGLRHYKKVREETYAGLSSKRTDSLFDKSSKWDERIQNLSNFRFSTSETRDVTGKYQDQLQSWKEMIQPFFEFYQLGLKEKEFGAMQPTAPKRNTDQK